MDRRQFLKAAGGLSAAMALPVDVIAKALPQTWTATGIRWRSAYYLSRDKWQFRASVIIGRKIQETSKTITIDNPEQYDVEFDSATEMPNESDKEAAITALRNAVQQRLKELNNG